MAPGRIAGIVNTVRFHRRLKIPWWRVLGARGKSRAEISKRSPRRISTVADRRSVHEAFHASSRRGRYCPALA